MEIQEQLSNLIQRDQQLEWLRQVALNSLEVEREELQTKGCDNGRPE